jgi:hypothetical protein
MFRFGLVWPLPSIVYLHERLLLRRHSSSIAFVVSLPIHPSSTVCEAHCPFFIPVRALHFFSTPLFYFCSCLLRFFRCCFVSRFLSLLHLYRPVFSSPLVFSLPSVFSLRSRFVHLRLHFYLSITIFLPPFYSRCLKTVNRLQVSGR